MNRRTFLRTAALGVAGATVGVGAYAFGVEPHWVETVERELPIERLPRALGGARLLHLSDLHVGPRVSEGYLIEALEHARALRPDITVVTGDLITFRDDTVFAMLQRVSSHLPHGRLATLSILGNHDYGYNWSMPEVAERVTRVLREAGVTVLRNDVADVSGLRIAGLDDLWARRFAPQAVMADAGAPSLVLCHNPDAADRAGWGAYRGWILAGHTHGGQCRPPFLPPPLLPVRNRRYVAGEVAVGDGRRLYINRGLGHLLPVRFNVRPEITLFTLA